MATGLRAVLYGSATLAVLLGAWGVGSLFYETQPRQIVATLLRIEQVPASLQNVACESWSMSDVLTTCTFNLDPQDFSKLLTGWAFKRLPATGGSYSFSGGPKLGEEFVVDTEFSIINPSAFANGGRVSLITDARRARAQLDYYEE